MRIPLSPPLQSPAANYALDCQIEHCWKMGNCKLFAMFRGRGMVGGGEAGCVLKNRTIVTCRRRRRRPFLCCLENCWQSISKIFTCASENWQVANGKWLSRGWENTLPHIVCQFCEFWVIRLFLCVCVCVLYLEFELGWSGKWGLWMFDCVLFCGQVQEFKQCNKWQLECLINVNACGTIREWAEKKRGRQPAWVGVAGCVTVVTIWLLGKVKESLQLEGILHTTRKLSQFNINSHAGNSS